jgi:four helix bundle protein
MVSAVHRQVSQAHENLVAWQRADDLCVAIYTLTSQRMPRDERFGLTAQLRRAVYSIAANIVEGFAYHGPSMRLKHLRIAVGSLAEVGYGLHLACRLGYLSPQESAEVESSVRQVAAPLHGLVAHYRSEVRSPHRDRG